MKPYCSRCFQRRILPKIYNSTCITPMSSYKLYSIYKACASLTEISGSTAEIGVYSGVTTKLIEMCLNRKHFAYDTYCGIVNANKNSGDNHKDGDFNNSLKNVKKYIGENYNINYRVGMFPESFNEYEEDFVFAHSDTDTYFGTKESLEYIVPRLVGGGIIIIDDYNMVGVKKACDQFVENNASSIKSIEILADYNNPRFMITKSDTGGL